jgi:hypothetical protein
MPGLVRIDVNDCTSRTLVGQNDVDFNPHSDAQRQSSNEERAMEVYHESLAVAG